MTIKSSAQSEAGPERSVQEFMTTMSVEWRHPFARDLLAHEHLIDLEVDNFHVILVPFGASTVEETAIRTPRGDTNRPLILPLTWKELVSKLGTSAQFSNCSRKANVVRFGEVTLDLASMEVHRSNRLVNLTAMEFKVLKYFVANPNRVISRDDLLDHVWGYENYPCTRTVDNHILRLRQKLELDFADPVHFRTVHGVGYKFTP